MFSPTLVVVFSFFAVALRYIGDLVSNLLLSAAVHFAESLVAVGDEGLFFCGFEPCDCVTNSSAYLHNPRSKAIKGAHIGEGSSKSTSACTEREGESLGIDLVVVNIRVMNRR